jgi:hypothetical protein
MIEVQMNTDNISALVVSFQNEPDKEIFRRLGELRAGELERGFSAKNSETEGRGWFLTNLKRIRGLVCQNEPLVQMSRDEEATIDIGLIVSVAGLLAETLGSVSATLVAILVVRRGLAKLCSGYEGASDAN